MTNLLQVGELTSNISEIPTFQGLSETCEFHFSGKLGNGEVASFNISIKDSTGKEVGYSIFMLKRNFIPFQVEGIEPNYTVMGRVENLTSDSTLYIKGLGTLLFRRSLELVNDLKEKCKEKGLITEESTVGLVIDVLNHRNGWTERRCNQFNIPKLRGENHWGKLI